MASVSSGEEVFDTVEDAVAKLHGLEGSSEEDERGAKQVTPEKAQIKPSIATRSSGRKKKVSAVLLDVKTEKVLPKNTTSKAIPKTIGTPLPKSTTSTPLPKPISTPPQKNIIGTRSYQRKKKSDVDEAVVTPEKSPPKVTNIPISVERKKMVKAVPIEETFIITEESVEVASPLLKEVETCDQEVMTDQKLMKHQGTMTELPWAKPMRNCDKVPLMIDSPTLSLLGWPLKSVDKTLKDVIRHLGHVPLDCPPIQVFGNTAQGGGRVYTCTASGDSSTNVMLSVQPSDEDILFIIPVIKSHALG